MLRRFIAIMAALMLLLSFVPFALAEEPTGYDNIIYSNDFQDVSAGTGLSEAEMNYRPENCDYAIVQDGENKYYKFSPNSTSTRSNSGNPELGYFLKETVMEKPVQKVKLEMKIAVTVAESGKVAAIASYNRIIAERLNIIEFDQTHFYPAQDNTNRVSYTSGEWLHFVIYADYSTKKCSVYVNDELVFDDVQMIAAGGSNRFTQIRLTIANGASGDNSMCVDDIVYSVTDEELENIRYTNLNPTLTEPKPFDYATELYSESFEDDAEIDSSSLEYSTEMAVSVENGDASAVSGKVQGNYVKLATYGQTTSNYFRMKYGTQDSPVQSEASLSELKKTHISFDICPLENENIYVTLYDKMSSDAEVNEGIIVFSDKGYMTFSNKDLKKPYAPNEWMSFDIFADFDAKTYTVYLNGNAVVKDVTFKTLTGCAEAVGFVTSGTGASHSLYLDNIRMAIREETKVISTYPENPSSNVSILDDISIKLSNPIKNFLPSMVSVKAGDTVCTTGPAGDDSADCIVAESNGVILIAFPENMQFDTTYTITLSDTLTDCYNESLGEEYVLTFSTMLPQITYSVPVIGSSVTAVAVNPTATPVNATLVVSVVDSDGAGVIYKDTEIVTSAAPAELEVLYNASTAQTGQKVTAFLCDGENTLKPLRDMFVTPDGQVTSQGTSAVTAEITKAEILGTTVTVEGKLSKSEKQAVIIKIADESNNSLMALPVVTDASGGFSYSYSVADMLPGKYFAEITGYYVTSSNKKDYIYLSDAIKDEIKTAINTAASVDSVKAILASYKSKMTLEDSYYIDNVYTVLFEQRPHESYDKLVEMIHKTGSLLAEINGADWTEYTKLFADNSSVVLYGESKLSVYNGYSDNQKNAINQILVVKSPFADFKELRSEFAFAVNFYTESLNDDDDGGGSGGGGSPSKVTSSYEIEPIPQENTENKKNLFKDMSGASWAQESVALLCEKGIVSAAEYYRPYDNVKREEFVKMLVELANIDTEASTATFKDVNGNEWYAKYLGAAQKIGIINGTDDGNFGVGKPITRQDMVVMALRMVEATGKSLNQIKEEQLFDDSEKISHYAAEAVLKMQRAGVISGMGNDRFEPLGTANRAQAAVIICNLIEALV